ncbi:MAG: DUF4340 domain-containing protein [Clostridia bacterium]|nr:DUF4340 domain-containing protein [Clostridia bacterium]
MKRSAKLIIMLGILAVLIVGAVIQKQFFPAENDSDYTDDGSSVIAYAANDVVLENVTALSYEKDSAKLSFKKSGEEWVLDEENAPDIDSELVHAMATAISGLSGANRMEDVPKEKLADYGLDAPALKVTVSEDDKVRTFLFGDYNKTAKEYYFCDEAIPSLVFTVVSSSYEAFDYVIDDLIVHGTLPEIAAENITGFSFKNADGETVIKSIKTPTDENEEGYTYSAEITKNGVTEEYSYADFYKAAEAVAEWNIDEFITSDASKTSEYGFETPSVLTVNYTERKEIEAEGASGGYIDTEKTYSLILGTADGEGCYYVKTEEDSRLIYKLSTAVFSEIFG